MGRSARTRSAEVPRAGLPATDSAAAALAEWLPEGGEVCALRLDAHEQVTWASPGCRYVFDLDPEWLVGRLARELFHPFEALPETPHGDFELYARRGAKPCHVRLFWWREDGGGARALLINLERASSGAFAEAASVARFASMVTHEVRNPLSSVKMVIQTMARVLALDDRGVRRFSIAAREIKTIERILSALSELCRPGSGRVERIDVGALVADAVQSTAPDFTDRGVVIRLVSDPALPAIEGDLGRVQTAITHLLATAAHASQAGELLVEATGADSGVCIAVRSAGPAGGQAAGAGLSLAMIERVAREHGGLFREDADGEGRSSVLVLPMKPGA